MAIRKDYKEGNKLDSIKTKVEITNYCPSDLSRIYSKDVLQTRSFNVAELSAPNKINVHIRTYVDFYGGYAEHGRQVCFGLQDSGKCLVKLTPIKSLIDVDPFTVQRCTNLVNTPGFNIDNSIFMTIAGPGWAQEKFLPKNRYSVMWTMIESKECHPMMKEWLENCNEIWAPTTIDIKRFRKLTNTHIELMHLGYDDEKYNLHVEPINISNLKGRYVFGVVGSWNKRKGIKKIIRAFCKAFKSSDPVSLLLICKYGTRPYDGIKDGEEVKIEQKEKWDINYEFKRYTQDLTDIPHICLVDIPIHEDILPSIFARIDCLVGFSMGESTWLPGLQIIGMGKKVIQLKSECSGFMDYLNEENSNLCTDVKYIEADDELVKGTSEYYEGQLFADGDEVELIHRMEESYYFDNEYDLLDVKLTVAGWEWSTSINNVLSRLIEIRS